MCDMMAFVEPYDISPSQAADMLGVHVETVKRWARAGKLPGFQTPGRWWRFRQSDLERFVADGVGAETTGAA